MLLLLLGCSPDDKAPHDTGCTLQTFYADSDGDGFGAEIVEACLQPSGTATVDGDCDDTDGAVHPDAVEICNTVDDDCDGDIDGDATDMPTWYADADGDGYGNPNDAVTQCLAPSDTVDNAEDCDDEEALAWTGNAEVCDGVDNDCNGDIDDGLPTTEWYADVDEDGFGDPDTVVVDCAQPSGTTDNADDCDDAHADVKPDAEGLCARGDDCQDAWDNGVTAAGLVLIDPDGFDTGSAPFEAYCEEGWTLLLSADGDSTYWGNNSPNWSSVATDAPPPSIESEVTDFHGQAYDALVTDAIRLCYQDTARCYTFEHNQSASLFDFFDQGLTHVEYSVDSRNIPDAGSATAMADYLAALDLTVHGTTCQWLGINDTNSISAIGLIGDWNGGCASLSGSYPYHDDLALGIGLQSCFDANSCSNGGSGHRAGQTRGVGGVDDSGVYGDWHVFGR